MATKMDQMIDVAEAHPMTGGVGPNSYSTNSHYQVHAFENPSSYLIKLIGFMERVGESLISASWS